MEENKTLSDAKWETNRHSILTQGLVTFILGFWLILLAGLYSCAPRFIFVVFGWGGVVLAFTLIPLLHRRYYAPRTGYLRLPGDLLINGIFRHKPSVGGIAILIVLALLIVRALVRPTGLISSIIVLLAAFTIGIVVMYSGYRTRLREMFYLGFCFLISLASVIFYHLPISLFILGISLSIFGLLIHRQYLKWWHAVKKLQEEQEDVTEKQGV